MAGLSYTLNLDARGFNTALRSADFALRGFEQALGRSNPLLRDFSTLFTGLGISVGIAKLIEAGDAMTQLERRLDTMTNSINAAGKETLRQGEAFNFLYKTANATGTQLDTLVTAMDRMLPAAVANGISFDTLKGALTGTIGALSLSGATAEEASRAFVAIGQVVGKNSLQMEELRGQLGEAMPTAMLIVADGLTKLNYQMGKTGDEAVVTTTKLNKLVATGSIDGKTFIEALTAGTADYAKIAEARLSLVEGQYVRLSNVLEGRLGGFMRDSGINRSFAAVLSEINDQLDSFLNVSDADAQKFGDSFRTKALDAFEGTARIIDANLPALIKTKDAITATFSVIMQGWNAIPDELKSLGIIAILIGGTKFRLGFAALTGGVGLFSKFWEDVKQTGGKETGAFFANLASNIGSGLKTVATTLATEGVAGFEGYEKGLQQSLVNQTTQTVGMLREQIGSLEGDINVALGSSGSGTFSPLVDLMEQIGAADRRIEQLAKEKERLGGDRAIDNFGKPVQASPQLQAIDAEAKQIKAQRETLYSQQIDMFAQLSAQEKEGYNKAVSLIGQKLLKEQQLAETEQMLAKQRANLTLMNQRDGEKAVTTTMAEAQAQRMLAREQGEVIKQAQASDTANAMGNAQQARLEKQEAAKQGFVSLADSAHSARERIELAYQAMVKLDEEARQAHIGFQKVIGPDVGLSTKQVDGLKLSIDQMQALGSATGEVQSEFRSLYTFIGKIDEAVGSIGRDQVSTFYRDKFAQIDPSLPPEVIEKLKAEILAKGKEMRDAFFNEIFGAPPDDVVKGAVERMAERISSIDTVPNNKGQLRLQVTARENALKEAKDFLAARNIQFGEYDGYLTKLHDSAAQAQQTIDDRALTKDLERIRKRVAAEESGYAAREKALDAYIEKTQRPGLFQAHLSEEKRKGEKGSYGLVNKASFEDVIKADTAAKLDEAGANLTRLAAERAQLDDADLKAVNQRLDVERQLIDLARQRIALEFSKTPEGKALRQKKEILAIDQERADLDFDRTPAGFQDNIDKEQIASQKRIEAAKVEAAVMAQGWYAPDQLQLAIQAAQNRLAAGKVEARNLQDAVLREDNAQLEIQSAQARLEAARQELALRLRPEMASNERELQIVQLRAQELDLVRQIQLAQDPEFQFMQQKLGMLQAQANLQQQIAGYNISPEQRLTQGLGSLASGFVDEYTNHITSLIEGTETLSDAFQGALKSMIDGVIRFFVQWGAEWLAHQALELTGLSTLTAAHAAAAATTTAVQAGAVTTQTAVSTAAAAETTAAWTPAAVASSIATWGGALAAGALAIAMLSGLKVFHKGGLNDDERLAKLQAGELVVPASHSGMAFDMLSSAGVPFGDVGGLGSAGGRRNGRAGIRPGVSYAAAGSADYVTDDMVSTISSNRAGPNIINVFSMDEVDKHLRRNPGSVVNAVERDKRRRGQLARGDD